MECDVRRTPKTHPGQVVAGADVAVVDGEGLLVGGAGLGGAAELVQAVPQRVPKLGRASGVQLQSQLGRATELDRG